MEETFGVMLLLGRVVVAPGGVCQTHLRRRPQAWGGAPGRDDAAYTDMARMEKWASPSDKPSYSLSLRFFGLLVCFVSRKRK